MKTEKADYAEDSAMKGLAPQGADGLVHLKDREEKWLLLQLFADGAEGAGGEGAAQAETGGTDPSPVAGEKEESFDELIKGRCKKDFDARVQAILRARLRQGQTLTQDAKPIIASLAEKYGMGTDPDKVDLKELHNRMTQPNDAEKEEKRRAGFARILAQTQKAKELYPSLDLNAELDNPAFARLLAGNVPVQTAYEVIHKDEILRGGMAYAAKVAAQKVGAAVQSNLTRPQENGLNSYVGAEVNVSDPRFLTRQMRQELRKRVRRGEKIVW